MLRKALAERGPEVVRGFRMRGTEISRMEAFVDSVFGFGLTLLVVSSQMPQTYDQLLLNLRQLVPFGLCFLIYFGVWSRHYTFCRRYGLEDAWIRVLTLALLFVMVVYLFPLRYLALTFVTFVLKMDVGWNYRKDVNLNLAQLFVIYGLGFAAIQLVFYLMYAHAYACRRKMELTELEALDTRWWGYEQALYLLVPISSIVCALMLPAHSAGIAGFAYFGMGLVGWFHGSQHGKRHRNLVAKLGLGSVPAVPSDAARPLEPSA